jgi:hypothetical protein
MTPQIFGLVNNLFDRKYFDAKSLRLLDHSGPPEKARQQATNRVRKASLPCGRGRHLDYRQPVFGPRPPCL